MFGQVDANGNPVKGTNEVSSTRVNKTDAAGWNANAGNRVSKLGYFGKKLGPNMMLKVMAGDEIAARTDYYYTGQPDNNVPNNILSSIVSSLFSSLSYGASSTNLHGTPTNITTNINTTPGEFGAFLNNQNTNTDATPQAYMNVLFFDENFNFVPYDNVTGLGSYALRVTNSGDGQRILPQISKAPKNGYAFVYLSNESKTFVYFDNFEVTHVRGRLIEENAYYAYGLKIAAISSRKLGDGSEGQLRNQYLYNDKELWEDGDLNWYDYGFRNYDPQIGRFPQLDPLTWEYPELTNYQYASNNPIKNIDLDGLEGIGAIGRATNAAAGFGNISNGLIRGLSLTSIGLNFLNLTIKAFNNGSALKQLPEKGKPYWNTPEAAAVSWGNSYNGRSIRDDEEYLSIIYSIDVKIKSKTIKYYTYTTAIVSKKYKKVPFPAIDKEFKKLQSGQKAEYIIHSHGAGTKSNKVEDFSLDGGDTKSGFPIGDLGLTRYYKVGGILATPYGRLKIIRTDEGAPSELCDCLDVDTDFYPGKQKNNKINYDNFRSVYNIREIVSKSLQAFFF